MIVNGGLNQENTEELWRDFFERFGYMERIVKFKEFYPDIKSITVSFRHIVEFNNDFAQAIINNPLDVIGAGESFISRFLDKSRDSDSRRVNIRLVDLKERDVKVDIRDIRSDRIGKLLSVTGIVRKRTDVLPRLQNAVFQCSLCAEKTIEPQQRGRLEEPPKCSNPDCDADRVKAKFKLILEESEFVDVQKIEVQENPETMEGGTQPQRITVVLEDDLTGRIEPGERVIIDGVLLADQKRIGAVLLTEFTTYVYTLNYRKETKEMESVEITQEDEEKIRKLASRPGIVELLAKSIAPTIYDMDIIKQSLVLQMFGGVRKVMKDGTTIRGDIHILIVGDPGTAKSQLLRYMTDITPRGVFAFGRGSSSAGLTAAAVRDDFGEGRWTLEAGVLVLANNGLAAIDELDKMDPVDTSSMHEAMEQQSYSFSTEIDVNPTGRIKIGDFVDSLMEKRKGETVEGINCEILPLNGEYTILSSNLHNIIRGRITQVSRHIAPDHLFRVRIEFGVFVDVTEEHPFLVMRNGQVDLLRACDLVTGDMVFMKDGDVSSDENEIDPDFPYDQGGIPYFKGMVTSRVTSVETIPYNKRWVYDVGVEKNHVFFSGDLLVHNSITISKAGIFATLTSRCSVLAAANPTLGRYDVTKTLTDQIKLPIPLLSRFDIIFKLTDTPVRENDTKLADHVIRAHRYGESLRVMEAGGEVEDLEDDEKFTPVVEKDLLRKYVMFAKSRIFPRLSKDAMEYIRRDYVDSRSTNSSEGMPITARQLESIIRLSEASARIRLSDTVTMEDAQRARSIINYYINQVSSIDGVPDVDILMTGNSTRSRGDMEIVLDIVRKLQQEKGIADYADIDMDGKQRGMSEERIRNSLSKLKAMGQLYEPFQSRYKVVN